MNSLPISIGVFALVLVLGAQTGEAIKCHICNSGENYEGDACADPMEHNDYLFDCTEYGTKNNIPDYLNATVCRKIGQTVQDDFRVVRICGHQEGDKEGVDDERMRCVDRSGTKSVKVTYCACDDEDGCNSASALTLSTLALLLSACLAVFMRS